MGKLLSFIKDRLKEPSTWRGLAAFATGMGVAISPAQAEAIIAAGFALVGILGTLSKG
jgi:hypothetical protein